MIVFKLMEYFMIKYYYYYSSGSIVNLFPLSHVNFLCSKVAYATI